MLSGLDMTGKEKSPGNRTGDRLVAAILGAFDQDFLPLPPVRLARIVRDMCGIAGIYARPDAEAPQELLLTMAGELRHREPDGAGLYRDGRFGMTNNRPQIVDLEAATSLTSEDGRYWVMQNGRSTATSSSGPSSRPSDERSRRPATPR